MRKTKFGKYIGAAALTGALTLASSGNVLAGDDDGDDDDNGGGDPAVVNTGGAFDAGSDALPLALAASGLMVVAGGAFAVRRRNEA